MTANGHKFATASLTGFETMTVQSPALTAEDLQRMRVIADSTMSDFWSVDDTGNLVDMFKYVVATFKYVTDANVVASFSPEILMRLIDLAEIGLEHQATLED